LLAESALVAIEQHLADRERRRTELAERARQLRRAAQATMAHLHEGRPVAREVAQVRAALAEVSAWVRRHARADAGLAHDALQEGVEACLLAQLAEHRPLPTPRSLHVEPEEYLAGLADAVGEVRRLALHALSTEQVDLAIARLDQLEALYRVLLRFETTRAILPLKPKQDAARSLLERTRSEVTLARMLQRARVPAAVEENIG
jgi:translin